MPRYPASAEKAAERDSLVGWQDRALVPVRIAAPVIGLSTAAIYAFLHDGQLAGVNLGGRTLVKVESLKALLAGAPPFKSAGPRGVAAKRATINANT